MKSSEKLQYMILSLLCLLDNEILFCYKYRRLSFSLWLVEDHDLKIDESNQ